MSLTKVQLIQNASLGSDGMTVGTGITMYSSTNNMDVSGDVTIGGNVTLGTGTTISSPASNEFAISTNGSERVRVDSSGRLAIGTTAPNVPLEVNGNARASNFSVPDTNFIGFGSYTSYLSGSSASNFITFNTGSTPRARIDSSGRLLVGTDSASNNQKLVVQGSIASDSYEGGIALRRGSTPPGAGHGIGDIFFGDNSGNEGASIRGIGDGTWATSSYPSALIFSTTAVGGSSPTEWMRIAQTGEMTLRGVRTTNFTGYVYGNTSVTHDVYAGSSESSHLVICVMNHFGILGGYGCTLMAFAAQNPSFSTDEIHRLDSGNGGSWSISKPSNGTLRITKNLGAYAGGGYYFVSVYTVV